MEVRWKGFPKPVTSIVQAKKIVEKNNDKNNLFYHVLQIPYGQIIGARISRDMSNIEYIDVKGNSIQLTQMELVNETLMKAINKVKVSERDFEELVFWFIIAGGQKKEEASFGSDLLDSFIYIFLVMEQGKLLEFSKWENCSVEHKRIFNVQDFLNRMVDFSLEEHIIRKKIKDHLSCDKIAKKLEGPELPAYAALLIPQNYLLKNQLNTWVLVKNSYIYVKN
jgi:hypothetical protein